MNSDAVLDILVESVKEWPANSSDWPCIGIPDWRWAIDDREEPYLVSAGYLSFIDKVDWLRAKADQQMQDQRMDSTVRNGNDGLHYEEQEPDTFADSFTKDVAVNKMMECQPVVAGGEDCSDYNQRFCEFLYDEGYRKDPVRYSPGCASVYVTVDDGLEHEDQSVENSSDFEQQDRYKQPNGGDLIDKWAKDHTREQFRFLMFRQMEKYQDRYGKKDSHASESRKIADYANRLYQQEMKWVAEDSEVVSDD